MDGMNIKNRDFLTGHRGEMSKVSNIKTGQAKRLKLVSQLSCLTWSAASLRTIVPGKTCEYGNNHNK